MDRCHLKGEMGDRIRAVLCAAGYNLRWLMRNLAKKHRKAFLALLQRTVYAARSATSGWIDMVLRKLRLTLARRAVIYDRNTKKNLRVATEILVDEHKRNE